MQQQAREGDIRCDAGSFPEFLYVATTTVDWQQNL